MTSSAELIAKLKEFEGLRLRAYQCSAGVWTIGYGHTRGVSSGMRISASEADSLLREDLVRCERYVNSLGCLDTQGQFDAVVDFVFNLGASRFSHSTLLKRIKQHASPDVIRSEFLRWVYAGGKALAGLRRRREWEAGRYFE